MTLGLVVLVAVLSMLAPSAVFADTGDFFIEGRGWGHGVGLSQWGAWEGAREGYTYDQILAFYYPGSSLETLPTAPTIKVRISKDLSSYDETYYRVSLKPAETTANLVMHNEGSAYVSVTLGVGQVVNTYFGSEKVLFSGQGHYDHVWVQPASDSGRVAVSMQVSDTSTATDYREYWGTMNVEPIISIDKLYLYNLVSLDKYTRGVAEIKPEWAKPSWPDYYAIDAVKAQAVAARTCAYAEAMAWLYYLNDDTRDIVYKGSPMKSAIRVPRRLP